VYGNTQSGTPFQTFVGYQAGNAVTTGTSNSFVGYQAGLLVSSSPSNTAMGYLALSSLTTNASGSNTAFGYQSLKAATNTGNTGVGWNTGYQLTTGQYNTVMGWQALSGVTTGSSNTAVGANALNGSSGTSNGTAIGYGSGGSASGADNTFAGYNAGNGVTSGAQNVIVGSGAGNTTTILTTGSNNILIGYQATPSSATVSNEVTIGNASVATFRIPGLSVSWTSSTVPNLTTSSTSTLTNKRIDPRVTSTASASSLTPDVSTTDIYAYTALAADLTINAPTGTPVDGDKLMFRILDNGTTRNLTWNATFTAIGVTIPTATTANKMVYVGCVYNAANTRWDVIAVTTQA